MAHCKLRMHTRGSQPSQFWSHLPDSSRFTSARSPFRKHKCAPVDDHRCWFAKLQSGLVLRGFEACILHYRRVSLNEPRTTCSVPLRSRVFIRVTANRTVTGRAPISCPIYAVQLRSLVANDGQPLLCMQGNCLARAYRFSSQAGHASSILVTRSSASSLIK